MIKSIVVLTLALLASLAINLNQWRGAAVAGAEHRAALDAAVERGRLEATQLVVSRNAGIALLRANDDLEIFRLRQAARDRPAELVTVYRDRIRTVEVPQCRASATQVAAVNEVLR